MSIKGLKRGSDVEKTNPDTLGGFELPTSLYKMRVDLAYLDKSSGGAQSLNLVLKRADIDNNTPYRFSMYMTTKDLTGNRTWYEKNGKKFDLPGFDMADQICQITAGMSIESDDLNPETKLIKLYDFEKKEQVPVEKEVLTQMINKPIAVGIRLHRENKKVFNKETEDWDPINEKRKFNEIHKVFYPDGFSIMEKANNNSEPVFINTWKKANHEGVVIDRYKEVPIGKTASGSPEPAPVSDSLFDDDDDEADTNSTESAD